MIFHYPNAGVALAGLVRARKLAVGDPGIKSVSLRLDREKGGSNLTIAVGEAGHWMSSSGEQPGTERQTYVLRQLGHNPVEQTRES